ncbi:bacillithiol system redox-active protein YtxJ [Neobacillus sp. SM06]|uniref:bacillithiol system redox-active protein YtxJ n=1 Tax=Neobacillus sp. SM06 TaxID=3422492 RepID=UPI003D28F6D3
MLKKLDSVEQFDELVEKEERFFLMKHSLTCPISGAAYQEYQKYAEGQQQIPTYFLAVQDARPLSSEIEDRFQIKHESPQAILFVNGKPVWNTSHWKIKVKSLEDAAKENE